MQLYIWQEAGREEGEVEGGGRDGERRDGGGRRREAEMEGGGRDGGRRQEGEMEGGGRSGKRRDGGGRVEGGERSMKTFHKRQKELSYHRHTAGGTD